MILFGCGTFVRFMLIKIADTQNMIGPSELVKALSSELSFDHPLSNLQPHAIESQSLPTNYKSSIHHLKVHTLPAFMVLIHTLPSYLDAHPDVSPYHTSFPSVQNTLPSLTHTDPAPHSQLNLLPIPNTQSRSKQQIRPTRARETYLREGMCHPRSHGESLPYFALPSHFLDDHIHIYVYVLIPFTGSHHLPACD